VLLPTKQVNVEGNILIMAIKFGDAKSGLPKIASSSFGSWVGLIPEATIDTVNAGDIFETFSNDFLAPNAIGKRVTEFSRSVKPIISKDPVSFFDTTLLAKNPDPLQVLKGTNGLINLINSGKFLNETPFNATFTIGQANQPVPGVLGLGGLDLQKPDFNPPQSAIRLPFISPINAFEQNPTAFDGFLGTLAFSTTLLENPIFFQNLQQATQTT
jgi:hypothetical protein